MTSVRGILFFCLFLLFFSCQESTDRGSSGQAVAPELEPLLVILPDALSGTAIEVGYNDSTITISGTISSENAVVNMFKVNGVSRLDRFEQKGSEFSVVIPLDKRNKQPASFTDTLVIKMGAEDYLNFTTSIVIVMGRPRILIDGRPEVTLLFPDTSYTITGQVTHPLVRNIVSLTLNGEDILPSYHNYFDTFEWTLPIPSSGDTLIVEAADDLGGSWRANLVVRVRGLNADSDGDGIGIQDELRLHLDPNSADSDGDGIPDGAEDSDGDGLTNVQEITLGIDPYDADSDNDGLPDGKEVSMGLDPAGADTDGDGINDGTEIASGTNPADSLSGGDQDGDGLSDAAEDSIGTKKSNPDTDGDGLSDGDEIANGSNPLNPDTDGDGLNDSTEVALGGDPTNPDSDGDGVTDSAEVAGGSSITTPDSPESQSALSKYLPGGKLPKNMSILNLVCAACGIKSDEEQVKLDAITQIIFPGAPIASGLLTSLTAPILQNYKVKLDTVDGLLRIWGEMDGYRITEVHIYNGTCKATIGWEAGIDWRLSQLDEGFFFLDGFRTSASLFLNTFNNVNPKFEKISFLANDNVFRLGLHILMRMDTEGTGLDKLIPVEALSLHAFLPPPIRKAGWLPPKPQPNFRQFELNAILETEIPLLDNATFKEVKVRVMGDFQKIPGTDILPVTPTGPSITLIGRIEAIISGDRLMFDGSVNVEKTGFVGAGTMEGVWNEPFGTRGVTVSNTALELGINWITGVPSFGVAGQLQVGDQGGAVAVKFDSRNVFRSMLWMSVPRLNLIPIFMVAVDPTLTLNPKFSKITDDLSLTDAELHIAPEDTRIGELFFPMGFRIKGHLSILGYDMLGDAMFDFQKGLKVYAMMEPLVVMKHVLEIDAGTETFPDFDMLTTAGVKKGPAFFVGLGEQNGVYIAGKLTVLGATVQSGLSLDNTGFSTHIELDGIYGYLDNGGHPPARIFSASARITAPFGNVKQAPFNLSMQMKNDFTTHAREVSTEFIRNATAEAVSDLARARDDVHNSQKDVDDAKAVFDDAQADLKDKQDSLDQLDADTAQINRSIEELEALVRQWEDSKRCVDVNTGNCTDGGNQCTEGWTTTCTASHNECTSWTNGDCIETQRDGCKTWLPWPLSYICDVPKYVCVAWEQVCSGYKTVCDATATTCNGYTFICNTWEVVQECTYDYSITAADIAAKTAEIGVLETRRGIILGYRETAQAALEAAKISLEAPKLAYDAAIGAMEGAELTLEGLRISTGFSGKVAEHILDFGLGGLVDIRKAEFGGGVSEVGDGVVDMDFFMTFMDKGPVWVKNNYRFINPKASAEALGQYLLDEGENLFK